MNKFRQVIKKREFILVVSLLMLTIFFIGCSSDSEHKSNHDPVIKDIKAGDADTLWVTFSDGTQKNIDNFSVTSNPDSDKLQEGKNTVKFVYKGSTYEREVDYIHSDWKWEKVNVKEVSGLTVLTLSAQRSGVKLDKIFVTTDLKYNPAKAGLETSSFKNHIYIEAEEVSNEQNSSIYEVRKSSQASQEKYIEMETERNPQYKFSLSGQVAIWIRTDSSKEDFQVELNPEKLPKERKIKIGDTEYKLGVIPVDGNTYETFPKLQSLAKISAPSSVDLSGNMPPIGNQGLQNSCVAWATAYAYKTYQEKQDHGWSIDTSNHQFSPAYVYNQINGGQDRGSQIYDAMNLITNQGVCPLSVMPYNQNDYWTKPNSYQQQEASKYKAKSWGTLFSGDVSAMKNHLAYGDAITVGVPVYQDINVSYNNPIYDNTYGELQGYHAITFVGYDDSKEAFKFINSWGSGWGFSGYGWMSYDLVSRLNIQGYIMTDEQTGNNDDLDPEPTLNNLALNKSVNASRYYSSAYPANAVDGDGSSCWATIADYDGWIDIDLGSERNISSMKIKWSQRNYPQIYYIQKWNGWYWQNVQQVRSNGDLDQIDISLSARYIRIYCTTNNSSYYTIYEWEIFGD